MTFIFTYVIAFTGAHLFCVVLSYHLVPISISCRAGLLVFTWVCSNLSYFFPLRFYQLRWNLYNIKLTILKWTVQRHSVHSPPLSAFKAFFFFSLPMGILYLLSSCPHSFIVFFCLFSNTVSAFFLDCAGSLLQSVGSSLWLFAAGCGPSCPTACGFLVPFQGLNPRPLCWKVDS